MTPIIMVIILWEFFMFINMVYRSCAKELRLKILVNQGKLEKSQKFIEL